MIMIMMDEEERNRGGEWSLWGTRSDWVGLELLSCARWGVGRNRLV